MKGHKWGGFKRAALALSTCLATVLAAGAHYRLH